jgi:transcriptional regulator with XRE-family HTH domain
VIREKRQSLGYGLNRFAAQVDVSSAHLSRIERGINRAQPEVLARIALGLGADIKDITEEMEKKR